MAWKWLLMLWLFEVVDDLLVLSTLKKLAFVAKSSAKKLYRLSVESQKQQKVQTVFLCFEKN